MVNDLWGPCHQLAFGYSTKRTAALTEHFRVEITQSQKPREIVITAVPTLQSRQLSTKGIPKVTGRVVKSGVKDGGRKPTAEGGNPRASTGWGGRTREGTEGRRHRGR